VNEQATRHRLARTVAGIVLLVVTVGIWACLWVPPEFGMCQ
jgi:hypothetical protein